jgi:uncharacterized protein YccT (UPF0319 family)
MNEARINALENRVRQLNWLTVMLAFAVILLGLRQIVWMQEEENWKVESATWEKAAEQRLQVAEQWEAYWHQQASEETSKTNKQR